MTLLKKLIEEQVKNNWIDTPVHYFGTDFNSLNIDEWVQVKFSPMPKNINDSMGNCVTVQGLVEIYTYGKSLKDCYENAEELDVILRANLDYNIKTEVIYDQGTFDNNILYLNSRFIATRETNGGVQPIVSYLLTEDNEELLTESSENLTTE